MHYAEKVERSTLKMGATFIDYLPETGSWIFEVSQDTDKMAFVIYEADREIEQRA